MKEAALGKFTYLLTLVGWVAFIYCTLIVSSLGQGFDRHLLGLRIVAEMFGKKVPDLYNSQEFNYLNNFILSTSTLTTDTIYLGGFGPVVKNGFGVGYNVTANRMGAAVTAYKVIHIFFALPV